MTLTFKVLDLQGTSLAGQVEVTLRLSAPGKPAWGEYEQQARADLLAAGTEALGEDAAVTAWKAAAERVTEAQRELAALGQQAQQLASDEADARANLTGCRLAEALGQASRRAEELQARVKGAERGIRLLEQELEPLKTAALSAANQATAAGRMALLSRLGEEQGQALDALAVALNSSGVLERLLAVRGQREAVTALTYLGTDRLALLLLGEEPKAPALAKPPAPAGRSVGDFVRVLSLGS
jgi:hypothetical protein